MAETLTYTTIMVVLHMLREIINSIACHLRDWLVAAESIGKALRSILLIQGHTTTELMDLAETAIYRITKEA